MIRVENLNSISVNDEATVDAVTAIVDNPKLRSEIMIELLGYEMHLRMSGDHSRLQEQIDTLKAERDAALTKCSPDIASIVDALLSAGLESWGEAAITAANPEDGVFRMVRDLESVARESPSWSQCDRIKNLFGTACYHSKVVPTIEQAEAMQAILDMGGSTGPVSPDHLNFHDFMGKK
jgi:hypothetical protein